MKHHKHLQEPGHRPDPSPPRPSIAADTRRWFSADLLGRHGEAIIEHGDTEYRLRVTRQGKLILTK
jgi:hemin uptake protein HemP